MEHFSFNDLPQAVQEISSRLVRVENLLRDKQFPPLPEISKLFTLPEAAEFCRMPVPTFRAHLSKRNVSGSKPGKKWIFTKQDLDKFLLSFHFETKDEIEEGVDQALRSRRRQEKKEMTIEGGAR